MPASRRSWSSSETPPRYETIEQFQATVKRDRAKWADVVKTVGAKIE